MGRRRCLSHEGGGTHRAQTVSKAVSPVYTSVHTAPAGRCGGPRRQVQAGGAAKALEHPPPFTAFPCVFHCLSHPFLVCFRRLSLCVSLPFLVCFRRLSLCVFAAFPCVFHCLSLCVSLPFLVCFTAFRRLSPQFHCLCRTKETACR